jgi:hypothetical protein
MRTVLRRLGIVTGVAVSAFAFSLTSVGQAVAQNVKPVLVQVINSSNNPVPVIGSVEVTNTASAPVATRDLGELAARNAFSEQIRLDVTGAASATFAFPPDKRLVAECVSISGFDNHEGGDPSIFLVTTLGGAPRTSYRLTPIHSDPPVDSSGNPVVPDAFAGTQLIRFYADTLSLDISLGETTNHGSLVVTVSGYLVDQP